MLSSPAAYLAAKEHNALPQQQAKRIARHVLCPAQAASMHTAAHEQPSKAASQQQGKRGRVGRWCRRSRQPTPPLHAHKPPDRLALPVTRLGGRIGCELAMTRGDWRSPWAEQVTAAAAARRETRAGAGAAEIALPLLLLLLPLRTQPCSCTEATAAAIVAVRALEGRPGLENLSARWWGIAGTGSAPEGGEGEGHHQPGQP